MEFNFILFYLIILIIKGVFAKFSTNSPVFCLLGHSCKLKIYKDSTDNWEINKEENCDSNDNEDTCSFSYNTSNGSSIYNFNDFEFKIIIFTLNNENDILNITIQNYSNLDDMKILAIIDEESEENIDDIITMKEEYTYLTGYLTFSIKETDFMTINKTPESGPIYFPLISPSLYFPNIISSVQEINTTFKVMMSTYNNDSFNVESFVISDLENQFNLLVVGYEYEEEDNEIILHNYFFESELNITIPPSNEMIYFYLTFNSIFINIQLFEIILFPYDISISEDMFLIGNEPKNTYVNFITEIDQILNSENLKFILVNKDDINIIYRSINYNETNNLLSISCDAYGNYDIYIEYIEYQIKTSAGVSIIYRIELDQNNNERFFSPHNVILQLKNKIIRDNINVTIIKDGTTEIETDYSLNDEDITLSINNTFIESGNYKILINNKKLSYDSLEYHLTIYETIKLEKKYISLFSYISITYPTDIDDILLNSKSIGQGIININNSNISIQITEVGLNKISLLLKNGSIYNFDDIYAIPQNYFSLKYTKCITGSDIPNETEFQIKTDSMVKRYINLSGLHYSYQKVGDNEKIVENIFPENSEFSIPFESNVNYIIKIYEKNNDIFFEREITSPKFTNYTIITPLYKSSIIFYNISCKLDNLFAIYMNETKENEESEESELTEKSEITEDSEETEGSEESELTEEILEIECPTEIVNNYLNCSISNDFKQYGKYKIVRNKTILGEYLISGDLTTNDPELIFNANILKENKTNKYILKGNLFDINQLDYIIINNNSITNFLYNETDNSKSFYLSLKRGVYQITIFIKTPIIPSITNNDISLVNPLIISIPLEITLSFLDINWIKYSNGTTLNYLFFKDDFKLKNNYVLFLLSETKKIPPYKNDVLEKANQCVMILNNNPTGIYKILLVNNETNESVVTTDVIIISNQSPPEFDLYPDFLVFLNDITELTVYIKLKEIYTEIIGVKCKQNSPIVNFTEEGFLLTSLYKNNTCYYYTKFGEEELIISSIDFNIYDNYNQFLNFNGEIIQNQCYYSDDKEKPQIVFSAPTTSNINSDIYFNYVESLEIYLLSKDNVKIPFDLKSKNIFEATKDLIEGNYNLIIQDYYKNYICNISNIVITNADFDSFGSINYLTGNSTFRIKNLLCPLNFAIYDKNKTKKSCSINTTLVNNKYQETIICNNLDYDDYFLYIQNHQAIEYLFIFYRTVVSDPNIKFSIINPDSLELIQGIPNEIEIKSIEFYINYIKTITISKEPIDENSEEEIEYIIFKARNSQNKISFIASDYAYFTIDSPNENYKYKIFSIEDRFNNTRNFTDDDSFTLNVISCSVIHKQFFLKNINDSIKIISCKNQTLLQTILDSWKELYSLTDNLPNGFKSCNIKDNDLFCYLKSEKIPITIEIEFFDKQFEVKFNSYSMSQLCVYMPNDEPINIKLFGEENEKYILSYSGETFPSAIYSNQEYVFENLNLEDSPIKIIINDISLEDTIILYNKLIILDSTYGSDKDNYKYFIYLKFSDDSFELDNDNMIFTLKSDELIEVNNTSCESLDENEYTIKCDFDLKKLGEGNYTLYYKNLEQCNYYYNMTDNFFTTLYPEFTIDDNNMIANSDSSLIFISDMNLTNVTVKNVLIELITGTVNSNIMSYNFIKNDYNITFFFDLSAMDARTNIEGLYFLHYNITKDENENLYETNIIVKQECDREKALVNNGKGECKYCIDRNELYPYFDYNSRDEIDSKRCISECPRNQVSYNNICFDECLNAENFVTGDIHNYIQINNGSCFLFELESITTEVANLDNQELNLTFNLNDVIDFNYFSIITIGNFTSKSCESSINKILKCIFNFSEIKDDSITLDVSFTLNNNMVIKTNEKVTVKNSIAIEICNSLQRYFNSEKTNNYCKCRTNKFDENNTCVKECTTSYYDEDQKCISECDNYILFEEINLSNHKQCLNSCPTGYDIDTENKICTCNSKIVGNECLNTVDSNPLRSVSPTFSQAINLVEFNFTFNEILNSSHRVDNFYLVKDSLQIEGNNCTNTSDISISCLFNLSEVMSDTTFEIYYSKNRIYKSLIDSLITIQVYKVCSDLNVRNEYDNFICSTCKEKELETPYFQYYHCVESCDNKTYYKSAIYDYYCVNCKEEGTYLFEEEDKCVLDCSVLEDKENYEKQKLCVKKTPICPNNPDNYCENNGQCYVINKTLTCDCPSLYYGELCEYSVDSSNVNDLYSVIEDTASLIDNSYNDAFIYNQTIYEFGQTMRILKKLSTSEDENEKELGIEMFNENEEYLKSIEQYTNQMIKKVLNNTLNIKTDTDIKSVIILSSASIFYLTRMIKPELLSNNTSTLRNLDTTELQNELTKLLKNIHKINIQLFLTYEDIITNSSTFFKVSEDNMTFFAIWSSDSTSTSNYKITSLSLDIPILEEDIDSDEPINFYVETAFSKDVLYCLDKDSASMNAFFTMYNSSLIENKIPNSKVSFPLNTNLYSKLNESAIEFYNRRGIDPYNKYDLAFTEVCYRSTNFEYDLTQEYRREKVYTGISLKSISNTCQYNSYNLREKRLVLTCTDLNQDYSVGYELIDDPIQKQKVQTLPIKCGKKFKGIKENIAIWLFFSLSFVFIIGTIFLCTTDQKEYLSKALNNDDIAILEDIGKKISTTERGTSDTKMEEIYIDFNRKKFTNYFLKNFGILHPLFTICSPSVLCPLYYSLTIFFNEIINILGYNAVFFNEKKIEKRIYDNKRDNFIYPMKNEFEKIFCSILTTIISTFILKLLNLTTKKERDILKERVKEDRNDEMITKKGKLRFTGYIIMTFFWIFFWYYCSIFCSMYVNAQYDWLYSSIWSLLLIYVVFAPCCIIIISILEIFKFEVISYYMKRLFIF